MVYINDKRFYDIPGSCGTCPFFMSGFSGLCTDVKKGVCILFNESHHTYIYPPARCKKLFRAAMKFPDGYRLVIVEK